MMETDVNCINLHFEVQLGQQFVEGEFWSCLPNLNRILICLCLGVQVMLHLITRFMTQNYLHCAHMVGIISRKVYLLV
ncbi:hypothetical protein Q3G72_031025 [Acer saccharum]|nr:hypothetical protein Q3G72_031025 [Acer saccharum]